jgi:5-methylcytosine-specific restriction endonuclease McrA
MSRNKTQGSNWIRRAKRLQIYQRDEHKCQYCGAPGIELDHVRPGQGHDATNLLTCCRECNLRKGALPLRKWLLALRERGLHPNARKLLAQRRKPLKAQLELQFERKSA